MIIYGLGLASIFFVWMLMYRYALMNSHLLQLTRVEEFDTRTKMFANLLMGIVPLISVTLAIIFLHQHFVAMVSGFTYFLYMPIMFLYSSKMAKRRKRLLNETME